MLDKNSFDDEFFYLSGINFPNPLKTFITVWGVYFLTLWPFIYYNGVDYFGYIFLCLDIGITVGLRALSLIGWREFEGNIFYGNWFAFIASWQF